MRNGGHARGPALVLGAFLCAATARSVTPACASRTAPLRVDQRTATRLLVSEARPSYPPLARVNYIHGSVSLLLTVNCAGRVENVHVVRGHPFLAIAALKSIRQWIYHPFITRAGPAEFQTLVNVNFALLTRNMKQLPPDPEKFLASRVRPPQLPKGESDGKAPDAVRMRVLVNAKGRVVDFTPLSGAAADFEAAEGIVSHWRFKPARWGTLSVPWYIDVSVPVKNAGRPVTRAAGGSDGPHAQLER